jgi:hypothetical protein
LAATVAQESRIAAGEACFNAARDTTDREELVVRWQ